MNKAYYSGAGNGVYMLGDREYGYYLGRITFMEGVLETLDSDEQDELANKICELISERIEQQEMKI